MSVVKSIDNMTNKALHHLGINRNDYKQEIDKLVEDTANQIMNTKKKGNAKGAGLTVLAGGPNYLAGSANVIAGGKSKSKKSTKVKKPRSAK